MKLSGRAPSTGQIQVNAIVMGPDFAERRANYIKSLADGLVQLAAEIFLRIGQSGAALASDGQATGDMLVADLPYPLHEAEGAFDASVRPLERLLGRAGEHHEEARGVGAVLVNQALRINAVSL